MAASVAFFGYVGVILLAVGTPPSWSASELLWGVVVVVGAALAGKALGLARSRRRWFDGLEPAGPHVARPDDGGGA